jgi:mercuric ion transport protein
MTQQGPAAEGGRLVNTAAIAGAALAASCCLLPLVLIGAGLAGAGLMMTMMQFEWITLPVGVVGLGGAFALYRSRRRQCATAGCRFVGDRTAQVVLGAATLVVLAAILLRLFPASTAALIQHVH